MSRCAQRSQLVCAGRHPQGQWPLIERQVGEREIPAGWLDRQLRRVEGKIEGACTVRAGGVEPAASPAKMDVQRAHQELPVGDAQGVDCGATRQVVGEFGEAREQRPRNGVGRIVRFVHRFRQRHFEFAVGTAEGIAAAQAVGTGQAAGERLQCGGHRLRSRPVPPPPHRAASLRAAGRRSGCRPRSSSPSRSRAAPDTRTPRPGIPCRKSPPGPAG
jgi:hypothetical protein